MGPWIPNKSIGDIIIMKLIGYIALFALLLAPAIIFAEYTEPAIINTVTDSLDGPVKSVFS